MNSTSLSGKRILLTHANQFMGPALAERFAELGAEVLADEDPLVDADAPAAAVARSGRVDVLVAHLAIPAPSTPVDEAGDAEWRAVFSALVDPLPRLMRAVVPQMKERRAGRVLVVGSASALRGMKRASTYSAARGAQLAYVQSAGVELAPFNIQVNAVAQNFVDNATYFPAQVQANPKFQERLAREVPLGRLVSAREDAEFCAYLCSDAAACFVGQVFPLAGGWAVR